jgi:hypothetical protein
MATIKNFEEYLNEASLRGNPGIPGESEDGGGKYLSDVERRAKERLDQLKRTHGSEIGRFMGMVGESRRLQEPYKKELEQIAKDAILNLYSEILDGVNLDIKFAKKGEIQGTMEKTPEEPQFPELEELKDKGIISAIQMRKIGNNIGQGEAKSVKKALNLPETRDAILGLMGQTDGKKYIELLNKITEIADFFDWSIPMEVQKEMWKANKDGFSGSAEVSWDEKKENPDKEEELEDFLKNLEKGNIEDEEDNLSDLMGVSVIARGHDFAMLLHEAIKGIWQLILANNIPSDEETAGIVVMNTDTLADELEDLRYGPYIAADLREFINSFKESREMENLKERVAGELMIMDPAKFLELFRNILNGFVLGDAKALDIAKRETQKIIDSIKEELSKYDLAQAGIETYAEEPEEVEMGDEVKDDNYYASLSKREIEKEIDAALDSGDFEKVKMLSKFINESLKVKIAKKLYPDQGYPIFDL